MDPKTPFLWLPGLEVLVPSPDMGIELLGLVFISQPNFNLNSQGTMAAEVPLAPGPAARHLGKVWDLILPDLSPHLVRCLSIFVLRNFHRNSPFGLYEHYDPVLGPLGYGVESFAVQPDQPH